MCQVGAVWADWMERKPKTASATTEVAQLQAGEEAAQPTDDDLATLSLQFVGLEPMSDFDYVGFARAAIAAAPTKPVVPDTRVQRIELTAEQRKTLTSTATQIGSAAPAVLPVAQMLTDDEIRGLFREAGESWGTAVPPEIFAPAIQRAFAAKNGIALPAPLKGQTE